jgi:hypothetical protein
LPVTNSEGEHWTIVGAPGNVREIAGPPWRIAVAFWGLGYDLCGSNRDQHEIEASPQYSEAAQISPRFLTLLAGGSADSDDECATSSLADSVRRNTDCDMVSLR